MIRQHQAGRNPRARARQPFDEGLLPRIPGDNVVVEREPDVDERAVDIVSWMRRRGRPRLQADDAIDVELCAQPVQRPPQQLDGGGRSRVDGPGEVQSPQ